jgi:hypothetical protein
VLVAEQNWRPSKLNEKSRTFLTILWSPSKSLRMLAQEKDIVLAKVHKVVQEKFNLFQYKVTAAQELKLADYEK